MRRNRGFTLIELMVVLAVIAIIAAIAIPAFTQQVRKSHRSDAFSSLGDLQLKQERWRASNSTYTNTLSNLGYTTSSSPGGYYTLAASTPGNSGSCTCSTAVCYQFTATAVGSQAADSQCATMSVTVQCGAVSKTSTPTGNTCW